MYSFHEIRLTSLQVLHGTSALPAMCGYGEIFSAKRLCSLYSHLVQPSMGMVIEAMIAHYSCMSSSLCHQIWLVSILKILILVCMYVSRVLFSFPMGDFCCLIMPYADKSQDGEIYTSSNFDHNFLLVQYIFKLSAAGFLNVCPSLPRFEQDSQFEWKWTPLLCWS